MRKGLISVLFAVAAFVGCTKTVQDDFSSIAVSIASDASRVEIRNFSAVWRSGDAVGLFFGDGTAEKWEFRGADGSVSGSVCAHSVHGGGDRKCAVYPYSADMSVSGDVVSTVLPARQDGRGSEMPLAAMPSDGALAFRYACGFVLLHLEDGSSYVSASLRGRSDETLAGPVVLDLGGDEPLMRLAQGASEKIIEVRSDAGLPDDVWFCLPPLAMRDGFDVTLETAGGKRSVLHFAGYVAVGCGRAVERSDVESKEVLTSVVDIDFRGGNTAFTEPMPTVFSKGIFNADTGYASGKTFYTKDNLGFTFYTVDGDADGGTLGVRWYAVDADHPLGGRIQMGRANSYIRIPGIGGMRIKAVELLMAGTSGAPYISATADGIAAISPKMYSLSIGEPCMFELPSTEIGKEYYLIIHYKMMSIHRMKITYQSI